MSVLEFWFDPASSYSYLAALRLEALAASARVELSYRPFLLGPLFTAQLGIKDSPFNVYPARGRYMWRDLERLCARHGLAWRRPSRFPRHSVLAARLCCACADEAFGPALVRAIFHANFAEDRDIADRAVLAALLEALGQDAAARLAHAESPEIKERLRLNTSAAEQAGLFGAPSFLVAGELFWGQDRLEDAISWAQTH